MSDKSTTSRKLATIMMADIVGYSRLMGAAERDTHTRVTSIQRELIEPTIKEHRGTLVKVQGDGFLSVFDSPVECVRCAIVIQQSMVGRNLELSPDSQIRFRIGINLGDVIVDADDIYGDGVNVAARLESEASPGTINISGSVFEQVRYKLVCGYQALGDKRLKNIQDPVPIYRVLPDHAVVVKATRHLSMRTGVLLGLGMLILAGGSLFVWQRFTRSVPPVVLAHSPAVVVPSPPPKPFIEAVAEKPTAAPQSPPAPSQTALVMPAPPPAQPTIHPPEMVPISGGTFLMGSNDDPSEKPVHRVTVPPFLIGKYLVTTGQWRECVRATSCRDASEGGNDEPLGNVSWMDAQQYVAWLSKTTKQLYRLPTEAEWEFAARGGTETKYWWGNLIKPGYAICKGCGDTGRPIKVGTHPANPYGVFDINGGMSEWVADCWMRDYTGAPSDGSARTVADCRERVLRGASWTNDTSYIRSASRDFYDPVVRYPTHGFRVAQPR